MSGFFDKINKLLDLKIKSFEVAPDDSGASNFFNCIKSIEAGSATMITWSLSIVGGTLLSIISDSYLHPRQTCQKMVYLLFILGWTFIGFSLYNGKQITGRSSAAELHKGKLEMLKQIFKQVNTNYRRQIYFFNLSLLTFGIWLILYLVWWIFTDVSTKS